MTLIRYILARLLQAIPVLLGVTFIAFLAIQFVPGDPIRIMMHGRADDAEVARLYAEMGMDRPVFTQFLSYLGNAATGDLGRSIIQKAPVSTLIGEKLAPTLWLLSYATVLSVLIALPLALTAAHYRGRLIDTVIRVTGMIGFAMPPFWVGLILMLLFGLLLSWFPIAGFGEGVFGHLYHLFLPALTVALFLAPILMTSLRASMLEALTSEYVETARAKGLSEWAILTRHVLRNALIPAITVLAVNISWLLSSVVIIEYVFSLPGLGSLLVRSVGFRDYPLIQGLSLTFAALVVCVNLLADIAYAAVDSRVTLK